MSRTSTPSVTVLLPVYNGSRFLSQQIDSVLGQKEVDVRIIIWDDGSRDNSLGIARDYERRDRRVVVVPSRGNVGLLNSVATLVQFVETPYFAMCDQDDLWDADKLSVSISAMNAAGAVLVYSNVRTIDEFGNITAHNYWDSRGLRKMAKSGPPLLSIYRNPVLGHTIVAKKEVVECLGSAPNGIAYYEPWMLAAAHSVGTSCAVDRPLGSYRFHGGNVVGPAPASRLRRLRRFLQTDVRVRQEVRFRALEAVAGFFPEVGRIASSDDRTLAGRVRAGLLLSHLLRSTCSHAMSWRSRTRESVMRVLYSRGTDAL